MDKKEMKMEIFSYDLIVNNTLINFEIFTFLK
jgi:hypothetical protein